MARVFMRVLGLVLVTRDGKEIGLTPTTKRVLLRLAAASPEAVRAEEIYRGIWGLAPHGQQAERRARGQVQKCVLELRRKLGTELVLTEDSAYRLGLGPDDCDWLRFENLVADGAKAEPIVAARLLDQALEMWPGQVPPEMPSDLARRLSDRHEEALRGAAEAYRTLGDREAALRYAEQLPPAEGLAESVREECRAAAARGDLVFRAFPSLSVVLTIKEGDLFDQDDANLAVGFGDTFDTNTDQDKIISRDSVQGQFLHRVYGGDHARLDEDLADELDKECPAEAEELSDKPRGKRKRYATGTTVALALPSDDRRRVFAFAHCRQDDGYVTGSTPEDLDAALKGLWAAARRRDMYKPLAMPVVGSGAARVRGLNRTRLITTIIASFLASCRENGWCATGLRIMVPAADLARTDLDEIRRYLHNLGADGREPA